MKSMLPKSLFLTNDLLLIFSMSWNINEKQTAVGSGVPLFIASLMLIDITYISSCNIRESKVMNLFCGLLALDSWYMVLSFASGFPKQTIEAKSSHTRKPPSRFPFVPPANKKAPKLAAYQ